MNLLKNKIAAKIMLLAMMLVGSSSVFAANKIYFSSETVSLKGTTIDIPVMLDCDEQAAGLQFTVNPASGMSVVSVTANSDRLSGHVAAYEPSTGIFMIFSSRNSSFRNTTGTIATITVNVPAIPEAGLELKLGNVCIAGKGGEKLVDNETASVRVVAGSNYELYSVETLPVTPGSVATVNVGLKNPVPVSGLTFDITLPEGFSFMANADGVIEATQNNVKRLSANASAIGKPKGNKVHMLIYEPFGNAAINGTTGDIFTFDVKVPETVAEGSVIKFENLTIGQVVGDEIAGLGCEIKLVDAKAVADKAVAEVKALEKALADAVAAITKDCPDVKDNFKGEEVAAEISKLLAAVNAAAEAGTLNADYDKVMAPKAEIEAAIAKLVDDAKAAQEKVDADKALKAAAEKAAAEIKALNDKLAAALESIAKNCPLVADDFKGENVADAIKALQAKVDAAVADGSLTEKYDEVMANTIGELIDTLVKEAEIAQAAAVEAEAAEKARKENNEKAYKEDLAAIDELTAKLQAEIKALEDHFNAIGETEPNWVLVEQTNILVKIRDLKTKADNENDRVAKEGDYRKQVDALDTMLVNQLIAAYVANVKTSGIDSIISDENLGNVRIYTIDGVQHNTLVPGVNIIVKEDGTTTKVYVK